MKYLSSTPRPAPIAQVTGASATAAAFEEVSAALASARSEGRLIQRLPLDSVDAGYLVRDRLAAGDAGGAPDEDLHSLMASLRARGQQTPIEVVALEDGRYGLISGWRRLRALKALQAETGEDRFGHVLALLRQPESASDAYVAMVEENEIRVGLSYYERARIVARAAELGVFEDETAALKALFAAASRAKRSKIGSFLAVYRALDGRLRFPEALPERLGLSLSRALEGGGAGPTGFAARLADRLRKAAPESAEAEQALLARALADGAGGAPAAAGPIPAGTEPVRPAPPATPAPAPRSTLDRPEGAEEIAYGIYLEEGGGALRPRYTLSGPRVGADLRDRLIAWLREQG
jgi:ParB/RepB/Spo0J family partition protein